MDCKTVKENRQRRRVGLCVGGDFVNLLIGQIRGLFFFVGRHYSDGLFKLLKLLDTRRNKHGQLAFALVISELVPQQPAVIAAGEFR
jgi:hypothetical protein